MSIDWSKPVQTRDGRKVRVLCTDRRGYERPVVTLIDNGNRESWQDYTADGRCCADASPLDLINVPQKRWVNLWEDQGRTQTRDYPTEDAALASTQLYSPKWAFLKTVEVELPVTP